MIHISCLNNMIQQNSAEIRKQSEYEQVNQQSEQHQQQQHEQHAPNHFDTGNIGDNYSVYTNYTNYTNSINTNTFKDIFFDDNNSLNTFIPNSVLMDVDCVDIQTTTDYMDFTP